MLHVLESCIIGGMNIVKRLNERTVLSFSFFFCFISQNFKHPSVQKWEEKIVGDISMNALSYLYHCAGCGRYTKTTVEALHLDVGVFVCTLPPCDACSRSPHLHSLMQL